MLTNTFCHLSGIGPKTEQRLWDAGIRSWDDVLAGRSLPLSEQWTQRARQQIRESVAHLESGDAKYFAERLSSNEHWRMFPSFQDSVAYVDIETTGLGGPGDYITTIALYDGKRIRTYVHDVDLIQFCDDIHAYKLLVTYNGKTFDVPFIRNYLGAKMDHAHVDSRYVLGSLGYKGGLKGCEKALGIDREELDGVDGYFAVVLWWDFYRDGNEKALETLLAYNVLDVTNLETLMVMAYNMKLRGTPFEHTHQLPLPEQPANPFEPDMATVARLMARLGRSGFAFT